MSLGRTRLLFGTKAEQRLQDLGVVQTLTFGDSDGEGDMAEEETDTSLQETSFRSLSRTPNSAEKCYSNLWDSGIGSPTPCRSPNVNRSPLGLGLDSRMTRILSPIPFSVMEHDDSDEDSLIPPAEMCGCLTPPHKKLRSLRLYDTPHTPKSLVQKAQRRITRVNRSINKSSAKKEKPTLILDPEGPQTNVNPFTPNESLLSRSIRTNSLKRARHTFDRSAGESSPDEDIEEEVPSSKKLALHEINTSRYNEEFYEVCKLGDGEFGSVHKCINRLDGCTYAIKKSKMPVAGSVYERNAMNEVYAHAVLGKHQHVVRYYSAWAENDHMYIQNEYCNGGSLADAVTENGKQHFSESELKQIMLQVAQGLRYIHSQNLVHLDIKPGNIFIHQNPRLSSPESGLEEDICDEEDDDTESVTYKIGDLGHVTSVLSPQVEEGDCRYLSNEVLQERFAYLSKADIFSLALTIFEAGGGGELPKNGEKWHAIRRGELPYLKHCSRDFNTLLKSMVHPDPRARPSAATLVQHSTLCPYARKTRAQLRKELNEERFKNEMLSKQLLEATQKQSKPAPVAVNPRKSSRLVGRKIYRSLSLQCF